MRLIRSFVLGTALVVVPARFLFGDTYTGVVSEVKHFSKGGVAIDLDGRYPNESMELYVPARYESVVGPLPAEGTRVTATGKLGRYRGTPEIKVYSAQQWKW